MTREELYKRIEERPLILDGATGSNLQKAGMPTGVCPELWIMEHEEALIRLQEEYVEAGTDILYAPTFSGNREKLKEYGLSDRTEEINKRLVAISKKAAKDRALVAGDMTMTGVALEPVGPMKLEELIDIYKEQARCLFEAGVDLFVVETMMSLAETRAAVIAIREVCDLPVMTSMTFQEDGRTLYGTDPVTAVVVLQSIGADVIGVNCSTGPEQMLPVVRKMKEYADVPLLVKPNAGLPELVEGETIYPMSAEEFASFGPAFVEAGAGLLGGCCGTTPEHIAQLAGRVRGLATVPPENRHPIMLASERKSQEILPDGPFLIIGERINPTGKKRLQQELREGRLDLVEEMAEEQEELGAHILDINMGTNGIDEKEMMRYQLCGGDGGGAQSVSGPGAGQLRLHGEREGGKAIAAGQKIWRHVHPPAPFGQRFAEKPGGEKRTDPSASFQGSSLRNREKPYHCGRPCDYGRSQQKGGA